MRTILYGVVKTVAQLVTFFANQFLRRFFESFGSYGFMILLVIVFFTPFLDWTILPAMNYLFRLITGAGF